MVYKTLQSSTKTFKGRTLDIFATINIPFYIILSKFQLIMLPQTSAHLFASVLSEICRFIQTCNGLTIVDTFLLYILSN